MNSQDFAWDSENERFYYVNNFEKRYVEINKAEHPEIYDFLMNVYGVNWGVIESRVVDYKKCSDMTQRYVVR